MTEVIVPAVHHLRIRVILNLTLCHLVSGSRRFEGFLCPHLKGQAVQDEGMATLWSVRNHSPNGASLPRRLELSTITMQESQISQYTIPARRNQGFNICVLWCTPAFIFCIFERKLFRRILGPVYDNEKENWRILTYKEIYAFGS